MSNEEDDDEIIAALILIGLTQIEARNIVQELTPQEIQTLLNKDELTSTKPKKKIDGLANALTLVGFSAVLANAISKSLGDEEEIVRLSMADQTPLIFMTQQDSKVDDKICLPRQGEVWAKEDPQRPRIPLGLHPHCRCFWEDPSGKNLGQF